MFLNIILALLAQSEVEMADGLRQDGKFWVVVSVISVVTLGILIYLFLLDRRVSKLEKE
ncbi:CcmD family protein [Jiulongibacter sp. NS-SX5]|uniref:CcmD family protein n=1 Tax=Jiulongibacter sp. NS-SX5 TaxID=3463854 RepID=UPI0040588440